MLPLWHVLQHVCVAAVCCCLSMVTEALHTHLGFAGDWHRWSAQQMLNVWMQAHGLKEKTKEKLDVRQDAAKSKFRKAFGLRVRRRS